LAKVKRPSASVIAVKPSSLSVTRAPTTGFAGVALVFSALRWWVELVGVTAAAIAFMAGRIAGVAYLVYMAWSTLRETGALRVQTDAAPRSAAPMPPRSAGRSSTTRSLPT
jgi:threonine/homoserine/homoserine lactone efflux protein